MTQQFPTRVRPVSTRKGSQWYTLDVKRWSVEDPTELHFDIYREGTGKWADWTVSFRDDERLDTDVFAMLASFAQFQNAKAFVRAAAEAALQGKPLPHAEDFEMFAFNGNRSDERWDRFVIQHLHGEG